MESYKDLLISVLCLSLAVKSQPVGKLWLVCAAGWFLVWILDTFFSRSEVSEHYQ